MRVAFACLLGAIAAEAHADSIPAGMPDLSGYATKTQVPPPATATPPATALDGSPGTSSAYARADHTHAARVQRTVITTALDGTATWTFARPIVVPAGQVPVIAYMVQDIGTPIVVQIIARAWTSDGAFDTHTAVTIRAQRARTLPATLLALTALVNFDIFGTAASTIPVNVWAADPTQ